MRTKCIDSALFSRQWASAQYRTKTMSQHTVALASTHLRVLPGLVSGLRKGKPSRFYLKKWTLENN